MRQGAAARAREDFAQPATPVWKRRWVQNAAFVAAAVIGAYALIYHDVVSRAREAYDQAETHMAWHRDPSLKQAFFDEKFSADKVKLDAQLAGKEIADAEYRRRLDALEFDRDFALSESSVKYAYQWYKDAYEMFSPPESKWVELARQKAPEALALWKQELRAQNVPFEESMLQ